MFENPELLSPEEIEALREEILEALRLADAWYVPEKQRHLRNTTKNE